MKGTAKEEAVFSCLSSKQDLQRRIFSKCSFAKVKKYNQDGNKGKLPDRHLRRVSELVERIRPDFRDGQESALQTNQRASRFDKGFFQD
jgi:hypothetical protein